MLDIFFVFFGVIDGLVLLFYLIFNVYFYYVIGLYVSVYYLEVGMKMVIICFYVYIIFYMLFNFLIVVFVVICYFYVCCRCVKIEICKMKIIRFIMVFGVFLVFLVILLFYFYYEVYDFVD